MTDIVSIIFSMVLIVLAIVLALVGFQMMIVLYELKKTLQKINQALDNAELKMTNLLAPLQHLGGLASGLKAGLGVFEAFVSWLNRKKDSSSLNDQHDSNHQPAKQLLKKSKQIAKKN